MFDDTNAIGQPIKTLDSFAMEYGGQTRDEGRTIYFLVWLHMEPGVFEELEPKTVHNWVMTTFGQQFDGDPYYAREWSRRADKDKERPGWTCIEVGRWASAD